MKMTKKRRSSSSTAGGICCKIATFLGCLLIALLSLHAVTAADTDKYLYAMEEPDQVFPVLEYQPPEGTPEDFVPDFLSDPNYPNARIVEFYAHWCPQ